MAIHNKIITSKTIDVHNNKYPPRLSRVNVYLTTLPNGSPSFVGGNSFKLFKSYSAPRTLFTIFFGNEDEDEDEDCFCFRCFAKNGTLFSGKRERSAAPLSMRFSGRFSIKLSTHLSGRWALIGLAGHYKANYLQIRDSACFAPPRSFAPLPELRLSTTFWLVWLVDGPLGSRS